MSKQIKMPNRALLMLSIVVATGCASQVGSVVEAPQVKLPPPSDLVQSTEPQPKAYFQVTMTDCLNSDTCDARATLDHLLIMADSINSAYASCKADSQTVRGQSAPIDYSLAPQPSGLAHSNLAQH